MWNYYGAKRAIARLYPRPRYPRIIEPFAGSAAYSMRHFKHEVLLVDKYHVVASLWKWLQTCSPDDILNLPAITDGEKLDRGSFSRIEAAWLMGYMVQWNVATPRLTATATSRPGNKAAYVERIKRRIARDLFKIKHWEIREADFRDIPNEEATWFIDPPYQNGGDQYKHSNKEIDYQELAAWARSRSGQVIVCETTAADWLPFKTIRNVKGRYHTFGEAIWSNLPTEYDYVQTSFF